MHEHITNCSFSIYDLFSRSFSHATVWTHTRRWIERVRVRHRERVCVQTSQRNEDHISFFCFCFSFMQTPKPLWHGVCSAMHCLKPYRQAESSFCHCIQPTIVFFFLIHFSRSLSLRVCCWCRNVCLDDDVCSPRVILPIFSGRKTQIQLHTIYSRR